MRKIAAHTLNKWGQPQRDAYIGELFDAFARLGETPQIAARIDSIRKGYRKFSQGSHVIFFRERETQGIEVIRVLHKRMDFDVNLPSP